MRMLKKLISMAVVSTMLFSSVGVKAYNELRLSFGFEVQQDFVDVTLVDYTKNEHFSPAPGMIDSIVDKLNGAQFEPHTGKIMEHRDYDKYISFSLGNYTSSGQFVITDTGYCYITDLDGYRASFSSTQEIISKAANMDEITNLFDNYEEWFVSDNFDDNETLIRAEACALISNHLKRLTGPLRWIAYYSSPISDIEDVAFVNYYSDIMNCYNYGIIKGVGITGINKSIKINPADNITKEEFYIMLSRLIHHFTDVVEWDEKLISYDVPKDFDAVSEWAKNDIIYLLERGLVDVDSIGCINPAEQLTESEGVKMSLDVYNYLSKIINSDMFSNGDVTGYDNACWREYYSDVVYEDLKKIKFDKDGNQIR